MDAKIRTLAEMPSGTKCIITRIGGHGGFRHRIMELGFVRGETVRVVKNAPLLDPIEYEVMTGHVSLRKAEAAIIEVVETKDWNDVFSQKSSTFAEEVSYAVREKTHTVSVALVGNPNCGKTSLFNHATGLKEKVGNYGGVTVESKFGIFHHRGYTIQFTDLPGTYSLTEYTLEERFVRSFLDNEQPDVVLNLVDSSNLERNLLLTTQLIDRNQPLVMAMNMYDELVKSGAKLDCEALGGMLGFPVVPTVAAKGEGIDTLLDRIIDVFENKQGTSRHIHINYGEDFEEAILKIKAEIEKSKEVIPMLPTRFFAIRMLEGDKRTEETIENYSNFEEIKRISKSEQARILKLYKEEDMASLITGARYAFVRGALKETYKEPTKSVHQNSNVIDRWLTNRFLGLPILLFFLWIMFEATFTLGAYPQDWIDAGVGNLGEWLSSVMPSGILTDLIVDGIVAGVGGVIVFLPQIIILFFFISLLEDTGYMARAAFILDRLMHAIGLHGKSFIPYLIGFGCGVPAIMSTRTLQSRKDRIITILTIPFMSCSARLPVYILFVSAFFANSQGLVLMSIYLLGIAIAVLTSILLRHTAFKAEEAPFVMELPPYRIPTMRNTAIHMWSKTMFYLKKMGTIILVASVIVWALGYFPRSSGGDSLDSKKVQIENSYIGKLGHAIEPVVSPLGFDWKMGVSIFTGIGAKEIVVSSMGVLYEADTEADEQSETLISKLQSEAHITPLIAYAFMVFVLLYIPCFAALAAIRREAGMGWAAFSAVYTIAIAWLMSFLVVTIGRIFIN